VARTLVLEHELSVGKACEASHISRTAWYRQGSEKKSDNAIIDGLNAMMERRSGWGFWKCYEYLCKQGHDWNHKRVWRVYCLMKLNLPRRKKRRLPEREPQRLTVQARVNESWSLDFMHDALYSGKRFRTLNVLDEGVRESLGIEVDTSLPALRVVRLLEQIKDWRGTPKSLRVDNGPELISVTLQQWCEENEVKLMHIQPGKPNQNAYIERFNRTFRHEVLNAYIFNSLQQVRDITQKWIVDYNEQRPHDALQGLTPTEYRNKICHENSSLELYP